MLRQKLKIKLTFSGFLMLVALFITHSYISLAAIIAATLHEAGHLIAAKLCKIPIKELKLGIFGAALSISDEFKSYKKEIILSVSGPLINLISVLILYPIFKNSDGFANLFLAASLFLGFLNLMPIYDFDGGRALFCTVSYFFSPDIAIKVLKVTSAVLIFSLWTLSVYLLIKLSSSLSLFVFSLSLFSKFFISQENFIY